MAQKKIEKIANTDYDWEGTPWHKKEFSHPERTIRIATTFSGIGAAEWALKTLGLKHQLVFACDIGERYLHFNFPKLAELASGLSDEDKKKYATYLADINKPMFNKPKDAKKMAVHHLLTPDYVFHNLFEKCDNTEIELELVSECIDLLTSGMTKQERTDFVNRLYASKGKNMVEQSFKANYPLDEKDWHNDVRFLDGTQYEGKVDLLVGGSPCQSFSMCGARLGLEDTRGTLFYDFARLVNETRCKVFIYENVKGLTNHDKGNTWKVVRSVFEKLGYDLHYSVLNAADYNAPQRRERLICIGFRENTDFKFPRPVKLQTTIADLLDDKSNGTRPLTSTECLRYMGFDGFKQEVAPTKMRHQCGNSIQTKVFEALYRQMDITKWGE